MFKDSSSYSYGLAAPVIGFVYSLALLILLLLSTRIDGVSDLMARASCKRAVLICDFVSEVSCFLQGSSLVAFVLLITAASAASAGFLVPRSLS